MTNKYSGLSDWWQKSFFQITLFYMMESSHNISASSMCASDRRIKAPSHKKHPHPARTKKYINMHINRHNILDSLHCEETKAVVSYLFWERYLPFQYICWARFLSCAVLFFGCKRVLHRLQDCALSRRPSCLNSSVRPCIITGNNRMETYKTAIFINFLLFLH